MSAKLGKQNSLSPFTTFERIDYPMYVPAKKRIRFAVHLDYPYPIKNIAKPNSEDGKKYRQNVEKYIAEELANLDGFDFLDEANRYEVVFPNGWKHSK
jgi:hypothetical protein